MVQLLLEKGADVNAQGGKLGNALQAASRRGDHAIMRLLIEGGADVNMRGGIYESALRAALTGPNDNADAVKLLIESGARREGLSFRHVRSAADVEPCDQPGGHSSQFSSFVYLSQPSINW